MKICRKCNTKNDNRKKKCTYCGASLNGVKIKEDDNVYMSTYRGTHDIIDEELDMKSPERLSKLFSIFIVVFFLLASLCHIFVYYIVDPLFIPLNIDSTVTLFWIFIYKIFINLVLNYLLIIPTLKIVFNKNTLYEDDIYKFMKLILIYFIVFSIYLAVFNYIIYNILILAVIIFIVNLFTLLVYFPIINSQMKKKLL